MKKLIRIIINWAYGININDAIYNNIKEHTCIYDKIQELNRITGHTGNITRGGNE